MAERDGAEQERYGDWRSVELVIKDAAKKAARQAGPGISAATVDAQIRQARFDEVSSPASFRRRRAFQVAPDWLLTGKSWIGWPRLWLGPGRRSGAVLVYPVSGIQGFPWNARVRASRAPSPWRAAVAR